MSSYLNDLRIPVEHEDKQIPSAVRDQPSGNYSIYPDRLRDWSIDDEVDRRRLGMDTHLTPWPKHFSSISNSRMKFDNGEDEEWYDDVRRRFDERRKQWDDDVKRMHQEFFGSPHKEISLNRGSFGTALSPYSNSAMSDTFHSEFERAPDGQVNFVAHFDIPEYDPQSVKVSVRDRQLFVSAKMERRINNTSTSREYTRSVNLPSGAEEQQINAVLSGDGVLVVTCPMKPPPFPSSDSSYTLPDSFNSATDSSYNSVSPDSISYTKNVSHQPQRTVIEPSKYVMSQSSHSDYGSSSRSNVRKPKFRLELPIDSEYAPEEIRIKTLNQRIYVNARHEERGVNRTSVREFSKEYDIPDNVDPESLEAKLDHGILFIEASSKPNP